MGLYLNGRQTLNTDDIIVSEDGIVGIGTALERIEFDGSGGDINFLGAKVGIGTSTPNESLEVVGGRLRLPQVDESSTPTLTFGSNSGLFMRTSSQLRISFTGSERWNIDLTMLGSLETGGGQLARSGSTGTVPGFRFTGDTNTGIGKNAADELSLIAGGANIANLLASGNFGIGMLAPAEKLQVDDAIALSNDTEGSTGRLTMRTSHETHTLAAAATSDTTTISIPSGARILAVSMTVNTTVVDDGGDDTWSAAFITGSTTTIVSGAAAAQNTKVDLIVPDEKASAIAEIRFTANGGSFSAGVIEIIAYYEDLTSLAN